MLAYGPIHQPADYHDFADSRALLGVPNAGDVLSNTGLFLAGLWGLLIWARRSHVAPSSYGYALFFAGMLLTGLGSGYYHWAPDDPRLVWDRLPIALACGGLLAAFHADSRGQRRPLAVVVAFVVAAIASVWWWSFTGTEGEGDLRPYLLIQVLPLLLIPVWQAISNAPRRERLAFAAVIALYVVAKAAEVGDHAIFEATGLVSGHTIKHLLATVAGAVLVWDYERRTWRR